MRLRAGSRSCDPFLGPRIPARSEPLLSVHAQAKRVFRRNSLSQIHVAALESVDAHVVCTSLLPLHFPI